MHARAFTKIFASTKTDKIDFKLFISLFFDATGFFTSTTTLMLNMVESAGRIYTKTSILSFVSKISFDFLSFFLFKFDYLFQMFLD